MFGFLEALLNDLAPGDEDDDYFLINDYVRQNYAVIPNIVNLIKGEEKGNKYLRIPLPQFWRGFHSAGVLAYDVLTGKSNVSDAVQTGTTNFIGGLSPIDIPGFWVDDEFSFAPIIPTVIRPVWEVGVSNRNFMGSRIAKEPFTKELEKSLAESGLHKNNVNPAAKFITDIIFEGAGGQINVDDRHRYYVDNKGKIKKVNSMLDVNPSQIEHLFTGYTGGTGRFISDITTTLSQIMEEDEEVDFRNIPFVDAFIKQIPDRKWKILRDYYSIDDELEGYKYVKDNQELDKAYRYEKMMFDATRKRIKNEMEGKDFNSLTANDRVFKMMQKAVDDFEKKRKTNNK